MSRKALEYLMSHEHAKAIETEHAGENEKKSKHAIQKITFEIDGVQQYGVLFKSKEFMQHCVDRLINEYKLERRYSNTSSVEIIKRQIKKSLTKSISDEETLVHNVSRTEDVRYAYKNSRRGQARRDVRDVIRQMIINGEISKSDSGTLRLSKQ